MLEQTRQKEIIKAVFFHYGLNFGYPQMATIATNEDGTQLWTFTVQAPTGYIHHFEIPNAHNVFSANDENLFTRLVKITLSVQLQNFTRDEFLEQIANHQASLLNRGKEIFADTYQYFSDTAMALKDDVYAELTGSADAVNNLRRIRTFLMILGIPNDMIRINLLGEVTDEAAKKMKADKGYSGYYITIIMPSGKTLSTGMNVEATNEDGSERHLYPNLPMAVIIQYLFSVFSQALKEGDRSRDDQTAITAWVARMTELMAHTEYL